MRGKSLLLFLIIALLTQQCAKQTAPTGGPKDEIPPKLIKSNPANKKTNFKGTHIELTFDEYLQLKNPREEVLITPNIGKKFEVIVKKNRVIMEFNSELQNNTTYTVNFREAIQDLTEKNPAKAKLVFSTGAYLDSLMIIGSVKEILSDKSVGSYTVAAIPASDTFNIFKHPASLISLTDKQGRFAIENLKPGNYFIYAFDDKNKNLTVDGKSEKYGFKSELINLTGKSDSLKLFVFKQDPAKLKLISARPTFAYFDIRLSKSVVKYTLTPQASSQKIYSALEPDLTTIKVYNTIPFLDSLQVRLQAQDSIESKVDTLIYIKFSKKESTKDKFAFRVESTNFYESNSTFNSTIQFSKPMASFTADSIYITLDTVNRIGFSKNDFLWNDEQTKLKISKKIDLKTKTHESPKPAENSKPRKQSVELITAKHTFLSVENDSTSSSKTPIKIIKAEDYGMLTAKIQTTENFILQLIDRTGKIIEEVKDSKKHTFENIPAGNYYMRILVDLNKNGKWDAGNYLKKEQPEPVIYYRNPRRSKDIFLKANWQVTDLLISY